MGEPKGRSGYEETTDMRLQRITLERFCGFRKFSLDVDDFTVLVGRNNSGKTTILRSVRFALQAVTAVFGPSEQPQYARVGDPNLGTALQQPAGVIGVVDPSPLYFGKSRADDAVVTLFLTAEDSTIRVKVRCLGESNNTRVEIAKAETPLHSLDSQEARSVLDLLIKTNVEFMPSTAAVSPTEKLLDWAELQSEIRRRKHAETWRNQLHWLSEGKSPEMFQRVVDRVREYVEQVEVSPPRRSKREPIVEVPYVENGIEYDIATSGAGLRTIFALAAAIELSDAQILLFDEPDSHLHSSLQRDVANFLCNACSGNRQIIIATHSPDFIEEVPGDSLVWIDRSDDRGRKCDEVGKALVDLGAIGHSNALAFVGVDTILFFENKPDRKAFVELLHRCGKGDLVGRARLQRLGGFGDAAHLPGVLRVIKELRSAKIAMAAILDADYTQVLPKGSTENCGGVLMIQLPCKELENLLLMSAETLANAAAEAGQKRSQHTGMEVPVPSTADVEAKIDEVTGLNDIKNAFKPHWVCKWARQMKIDLNDEGQLKRGNDDFEKRWSDPEWRRRCCPGKEVLKQLRRWLQDEYGLSVGLSLLFKHYNPDPDLVRLFDALESHVHDELEP